MKRGDAAAAIARAPHRLKGAFVHGGQEHFYLEGQVALAVPREDGDVTVHCSTQHPTEVQHMVAHVLGRPNNAVTVECRRMGGGFGGKETQGSQWAAIAALAAVKLKRPVKCRLDRDDDMIVTGKRHDFRIDYEVGFDDEGRILGIDFEHAARCGYSADLSGADHRPRACSTPTTATSSRRCASARSAARPTRSPTPPSAASAARRAWSASSG